MKNLRSLNRTFKLLAIGLLLGIILMTILFPSFRTVSDWVRQLFLFIFIGLLAGMAYTQVELARRSLKKRSKSDETD